MKKTWIIWLSCICVITLINTCSFPFITLHEIENIQKSKNPQTRYVFYNQTYKINRKNKVLITIHKAIRIGKDIGNIDKLLTFYNSDIYQLKKLYARHYSQGKIDTYTKRDLLVIQMSSAHKITDENTMVLSIPNKHPDDVIEIYYEIKYTLPFLRLDFSLDEIDICAEKIQCKYELAPGNELIYKTLNHSQIPIENSINNTRILCFSWDNWVPMQNDKLFIKKNASPGIIANCPNIFSTSQLDWKDFGDKYLELIDHRLDDPLLEETVKKIVQGCSNELEQMLAIVSWCKKNIRYEQVYLKKGQVVPNSISDIINRKYGDCKDYSLIIYSLAKKIGINPKLALCYLGKGVKFYPEVPTLQFNHIIVYWNYNGKDYWFDGTNRTSKPGIFSDQLINQTALVIEKNQSQLKLIKELSNNSFEISADLKPKNNSLTGHLNISLHNQYAVDFIYLTNYLNDREIHNFLFKWCCKRLHPNIVIRNIYWLSTEDKITFTMDVLFPESVIEINNIQYVSLTQIFPNYFSDEIHTIEPNEIFYNPIYSHGAFYVMITTEQDILTNLMLSYDFPDGPFTSDDSPVFYSKFIELMQGFSKTYVLNQGG